MQLSPVRTPGQIGQRAEALPPQAPPGHIHVREPDHPLE
jgi:hypothetical protein